MSPEYVRLEKVLHEISEKSEFPPYDIQWVEDTRNSYGLNMAMILYVNFDNNEKWEYHHFLLPNREIPLANILVDTFMLYMI